MIDLSLPSYSPELHPDERLNAELKCVIGNRVLTRTIAKLRAVTEVHMTSLSEHSERVRAYFQDSNVGNAV